MAALNSDGCPCSSGETYGACCRPYHRAEQEPATPSLMMRARFSAFATGNVDFLWRTLDLENADRRRWEQDVRREVLAACNRYRYVRLSVLDARRETQDALGEVLFFAELFEKGLPRGFVELSCFRHDGTGWRYWRGQSWKLGGLPKPAAQLRFADVELL